MAKYYKPLEFIWLFIFFMIITIYYYRDALPFQPGLLRNFHDQLGHVWILGWDWRAIISQPLNIFNAPINYPALNTLAGTDHLLGLMPFWITAYLITGDFVAAHNYTFLTGFIISGLGAYYYFRHWNINTATSLLVASFYAFVLTNNDPDQMQLSFFGYAFFVFLFLEKFIRSGRSRNLIFMSFFFILGFSSSAYFAYMFNISIFIYLSITLLMSENMDRKKLLYIISAFGVSMIIMSPLIYHYVIFSKASKVVMKFKDIFVIGFSKPADNFILLANLIFILAGFIFLFSRSEPEKKRIYIIALIISGVFQILTMGPVLRIGGKATGFPLPYKLFQLLPAFGSIRFIGRFKLMAYIGEAFLLASIVDGLTKDGLKFTRKSAPGLIAFALIFISTITWINRDAFSGADSRFKSIYVDNFSRIPNSSNLPAVYAKLDALPDSGPIVEFPLLPTFRNVDLFYQYFGLYHRHRIFNGSTSYIPYGNELMWKQKDMSPEGWAAFFRAIDIKYIVTHPPDFIVQVIESAFGNSEPEVMPLPAPDVKRADSIIWMDPAEKAIYVNGLRYLWFDNVVSAFGAGSMKRAYPAKAGIDAVVIDLGHDESMLKKSGSIPELPPYAVKNGGILSVDHENLETMMNYLGPAAHYILLRQGIDRIEIHGFRRTIKEGLRYSLMQLTESEAQKIGLSKVFEVDGSAVWRIEPKPEIRFLKEPEVNWEFSIAKPNVVTAKFSVSVPAGAVWRNPNIYGNQEGHVEFRIAGREEAEKSKIQFNLPLAVTEYNPIDSEADVEVQLQPGSYNASINIPGFYVGGCDFTIP